MSKDIKSIWAKEVEDRLAAYDKGFLSTVSAKDVFEKYQKLGK